MAIQTDRINIDDTLYIFLQNNSKRWYARFQLFGKWYCKSTKQTDSEEAKASARYIRNEFKIKIETGTLSTSKRFKDVAEKAIRDMEYALEMGVGKVSYKDYINALRKYHIPIFDRTYITSIDQEKLKKFNIERRKIATRELSKSTILNHNAALNAVFKVAVDNQWMSSLQVPSLNNTGKAGTRRASFTLEEYECLCNEVARMEKESRKEVTKQIRRCLFDYMEFAINTGLRPGSELDGLTWGDLHIETQAHKVRFSITVRKGKTTKFTGTRTVVCNANIYDSIWSLTRDFPDRKPTDLIFRLKDGRPTKELGRNFTAALDNLEMRESPEGIRSLYSLRHSYITWELMAQRSTIDVLAKQCGTSIAMIEQHYSHIIPKMFSNQLSGVEMDEVKQIKNRFGLSTDKAIATYTKRAKEWRTNYKRRGCI